MRAARNGADEVRIRLTLAEAHVLEALFGELAGDLRPDGLAAGDPVRERLYPAGYQDAEQAQAFRELTEATLRTERSERLEQCLAELRSARSLLRTEVTLDAEGTQRWLRVLNDLRLTVGVRLGVSEDDEDVLAGDDRDDPDLPLRARYLWLTAFQDVLVTTVMP